MFRVIFTVVALSTLFFSDNIEGVQLGIVGGLVSGIVNLAQGPGGKKQKKYLKEVYSLYKDMPLPEFEKLIAPRLLSTGEITPETYEAIIEGDRPEIQEDPALRESQLRSLGGMEQVAREGLPLRDRLAAQDAQRSVAGELERADEGIMRNLKQRGRAGGGSELAARLATQGRAAETARGMGSDLAQQAVANRLMALQAAPQMAGQIRGQDFNTAAQNSSMQQRYNEFISNLQTTAAMNAAQQRANAQQMNLANRQRISDYNITAPYQTQLDRDTQQQNLFGANLQKTGGIAGALGDLGQLATDREAVKRAQISAIGAGVDSAVGSIGKGTLGGGVLG